MNKIILLILILGLCCCKYENNCDCEEHNEYSMNCVFVIDATLVTRYKRCENNEVVCYVGDYRGGIDCKWKQIGAD